MSYEAFVAHVPAGLQMNHRCHNVICVNPDHLYPGTQAENLADAVARGTRGPRKDKPHGSLPAIKRHRAAGEQLCDECAARRLLHLEWKNARYRRLTGRGEVAA